MHKKESRASEDLTLMEEFQSIDAMVSAFDAEGDGPLRKGESAFNWSLVEERCLPLAELSKDLRVGIWLIRAALASLQIKKFETCLTQLANWAALPAEELHPTPLDGEDEIHALILGWLPYIFATCRFAHYLKCIVRDKIGSFKSRDDTQRWLNEWLMKYVDGDPSISSEATKSRRPLSAAEVVVDELPDNPGYYRAQFFLRPHFQLEGLTVSLRLVGAA
jgi:EvpB/VC_A0108, tail sheath gpW/gp25-like domain/ImpA, N-terminal, type VI secretion system